MSLRPFLFFSCCLWTQLFGAEEEIASPANQNRASEEETLHIQAIVISSGTTPLLDSEKLKSASCIQFCDIVIPGKEEDLADRLISIAIDQPIDNERLANIKTTILQYYREQGRYVVEVVIPPQDVSNGVVQVKLYEGKVGEIQVDGNRWSNQGLLEKQLGMRQGEPIDNGRIRRALYAMNRNPFRQVSVIYKPGSHDGATDITLAVDEKKPWRLYVASENNGIKFAGRQRWLAGINWGNVFGLNHIFTYQYITANQVSEFQAHTVQYIAPLSNDHILQVYGGYSYLHPKPSGAQSSNGYSGQASVRYSIPITPGVKTTHEIIFGADFKTTNTVVEYLDLSFSPTSSKVNLTQLVGGYEFHFASAAARIFAKGEFFWSPGSWLPDQSNARYNKLRAGATHRWLYGRGVLDITWELPRSCNLNLHALAQYATNNLLPSEQLGIGGYDTVRGYDERLLSKESGAMASLELRSPLFPIPNGKKIKGGLIVLGFCDFGWGMNRTQIGTWERYDTILGMGPGIRYQLDQYLQARVDLGYRLLAVESPKTPLGNFLHFSVSSSY